jgi:hypothetical protein
MKGSESKLNRGFFANPENMRNPPKGRKILKKPPKPKKLGKSKPLAGVGCYNDLSPV